MKMSLTDFVDVVMAAGVPKATKVGEIKNRPAYHPAKDFYRALREHIVVHHKRAQPRAGFVTSMPVVLDPKKQPHYQALATGYSKWWGKKSISWFQPPSNTLVGHGVEVAINPELGLQFGTTSIAIKLYFKDKPIAKKRADLVTELMRANLAPTLTAPIEYGVLDVRTSKLYTAGAPSPKVAAAAMAELAYIAALWPFV